MSSFLPTKSALVTGTKLTVVMLVPMVLTVVTVGGKALLPMIMGLLASAVVPYSTPRQSVLLIAGLALTGTLATWAYGNPLAAVAVVVAACIAAGLVGMLSAGLYGVAPIVAAVLALDQPQNSPLAVGLIMLVAGAYVLLVSRLLKFQIPPSPVPFNVAARHAVVMALACGVATGIGAYYQWPRAYWLVMTLAVVLRPFVGESLQRNRQRILGTIAGAAIAAVLSPIPSRPGQLLLAAVCMILMFAFMTMRDYALQVAFMTPMVIFLVSTGSTSDTLSMDWLRIVYTVSACVVGGLLALALSDDMHADETSRTA